MSESTIERQTKPPVCAFLIENYCFKFIYLFSIFTTPVPILNFNVYEANFQPSLIVREMTNFCFKQSFNPALSFSLN